MSKFLDISGFTKLVNWCKQKFLSTDLLSAGNDNGSLHMSDCEANGVGAFAMGDLTKANGFCSCAEGQDTKALGLCSHVQGQLNKPARYTIHQVGIGDVRRDIYKNAEEIYCKNDNEMGYIEEDSKNGYKYLIGVGGYDGTNLFTDYDEVNKDGGTVLNTSVKSVQEVINDCVNRLNKGNTFNSDDTIITLTEDDYNGRYTIAATPNSRLFLIDNTLLNKMQEGDVLDIMDLGSGTPQVSCIDNSGNSFIYVTKENSSPIVLNFDYYIRLIKHNYMLYAMKLF